jgi:hypothetical protein
MLELNIQGSVDFSSLQVLGIRKIIIKSPGSVSHNLSMNYANELPIYHQFATLVSQNPLHCLHLAGPSEWSTVWQMLQTSAHASGSQVRLPDITTSVVTPDLFAYLALYSGLKKLTLKSLDGGSREQTDRLADSFFETPLRLPPNDTSRNLDGAWVQVRAVGFFFTLDFHVVYEIFSL